MCVVNGGGRRKKKSEWKVASIIEQLQHLLKCWLSCIDFSTHYKNTYMLKTADVYCSEITFFTMMHSPPKKTKETILYKECKWKLWKVKYENVFKITVVSAVTRPSTNHEEKHNIPECLIKLIWKSIPAQSIVFPCRRFSF